MISNELRIGNNFQDKEKNVLSVYGMAPNDDKHGSSVWYDQELGFYLDITECYPIPLTKDWLKKFGFEWHEGWMCWLMNYNPIAVDGLTFFDELPFKIGFNDGSGYLYSDDFETEFKYVHQLQNLYFVLTGKELEI